MTSQGTQEGIRVNCLDHEEHIKLLDFPLPHPLSADSLLKNCLHTSAQKFVGNCQHFNFRLKGQEDNDCRMEILPDGDQSSEWLLIHAAHHRSGTVISLGINYVIIIWLFFSTNPILEWGKIPSSPLWWMREFTSVIIKREKCWPEKNTHWPHMLLPAQFL